MFAHDAVDRDGRYTGLAGELLHGLLVHGAILLKHLKQMLFLFRRQFLRPTRPWRVLHVFVLEAARLAGIVTARSSGLLESIDGRLGHARHRRDSVHRHAFLDQSQSLDALGRGVLLGDHDVDPRSGVVGEDAASSRTTITRTNSLVGKSVGPINVNRLRSIPQPTSKTYDDVSLVDPCRV